MSELSPTTRIVLAFLRTALKPLETREIADQLNEKYNTMYQTLRSLEEMGLVVRTKGEPKEGTRGQIPDVWVAGPDDVIDAYEIEAREKRTTRRVRRVELRGDLPFSRWEEIYIQETMKLCMDVVDVIRELRQCTIVELRYAFAKVPLGYTRSVESLLEMLAGAEWIVVDPKRKRIRLAEGLDRETLWTSIRNFRANQRSQWEVSDTPTAGEEAVD